MNESNDKKVQRILQNERQRQRKDKIEQNKDCRELVEKLKYLVNNPITEGKWINEINNPLGFINYYKYYYLGCPELKAFVEEHNKTNSNIKFGNCDQKYSSNYIGTHINIYNNTIEYTFS